MADKLNDISFKSIIWYLFCLVEIHVEVTNVNIEIFTPICNGPLFKFKR